MLSFGDPRPPRIRNLILSPAGLSRGAFNKCIFWLKFPKRNLGLRKNAPSPRRPEKRYVPKLSAGPRANPDIFEGDPVFRLQEGAALSVWAMYQNYHRGAFWGSQGTPPPDGQGTSRHLV